MTPDRPVPPAPRRRSVSVPLAFVPFLAASFLAGCGDDDETAYCVNERNEVIEEEACDQGRPGAFVFFGAFGGRTIGRGSVLTDGDRIPAADRARVAERGGFGGTRRPGGVGRSVSGGGGGLFGSGGG